jgi:hypothetical protein
MVAESHSFPHGAGKKNCATIPLAPLVMALRSSDAATLMSSLLGAFSPSQ